MRDMTEMTRDISQEFSAGDMYGTMYSQGYIEISIENPETIESWEEGKYTLYDVVLETNNKAFSLPRTTVQRRYSEFVWLKKQLADHYIEIKPPSLPRKTIFGNRFDPQLIESRMLGLQDFLQKVAETPRYQSDAVLHLFLQTQLKISEIMDCVDGRSKKSVLNTILESGCDGSIASSGYESTTSAYTAPLQRSYSMPHTSVTLLAPESPIVSPINPPDGDSILDNAKEEKTECVTRPILRRSASTPAFLGMHRRRNENSLMSLDTNTSFGSISKYSDSGMSTNSSEDSRRSVRHQRRVTFSPEVTVAEVIDKFTRSPRTIKLSQMPPSLIAPTMAY